MIDYLYTVAVEVTRRCNLKCAHCLRGNAQPVDLNLDHWDTFAGKVGSFGTITFTGGEPFLRIEIVDQMRLIADRNGLDVQNYYVATNGTVFTRRHHEVMERWHWFCSDNDISAIDLSNDQWHKDQLEDRPGLRRRSWDVLERLEQWGECVAGYESRFHLKYGNSYQPGPDQLIAGGRWKGGSPRVEEPETIRLREEDGQRGVYEGNIYMNVFGEIFAGCDLSFQSQRDKLGYICHVDDFDWEALEKSEHSTWDEY